MNGPPASIDRSEVRAGPLAVVPRVLAGVKSGDLESCKVLWYTCPSLCCSLSLLLGLPATLPLFCRRSYCALVSQLHPVTRGARQY